MQVPIKTPSKNLKCTVCSFEALRVKDKCNLDKYRISYVTYLRARLVLDSACFLKDEVYDRVEDLQEPRDILAADIHVYYHTECFSGITCVYMSVTLKTKISTLDLTRVLLLVR